MPRSFETVLAWKSDQYLQSGKRDLFAPGWIREAVGRIFGDACRWLFWRAFIALRRRPPYGGALRDAIAPSVALLVSLV